MKIIEVDWIDAESWSGWSSREEMLARLAPGRIQKSVGYLLKEDAEGVTIVQTCQVPGDNVADGIFIPQKYIVNSRLLRKRG